MAIKPEQLRRWEIKNPDITAFAKVKSLRKEIPGYTGTPYWLCDVVWKSSNPPSKNVPIREDELGEKTGLEEILLLVEKNDETLLFWNLDPPKT